MPGELQVLVASQPGFLGWTVGPLRLLSGLFVRVPLNGFLEIVPLKGSFKGLLRARSQGSCQGSSKSWLQGLPLWAPVRGTTGF